MGLKEEKRFGEVDWRGGAPSGPLAADCMWGVCVWGVFILLSFYYYLASLCLSLTTPAVSLIQLYCWLLALSKDAGVASRLMLMFEQIGRAHV